MNTYFNTVKDMILFMTDRCLDKWRSGDKLAETLKAHCHTYFTPNDIVLGFFKKADDSQEAEAFYKAIIQSNQEIWDRYTDEQAEKVYQAWVKVNE